MSFLKSLRQFFQADNKDKSSSTSEEHSQDQFTSQKQQEKAKKLDQREAYCPSCRGPLKKVPGQKTKCPHCEEFMFVRTRPLDNTRVVVTDNEASKIDQERKMVSFAKGGREIHNIEDDEYQKEEKLLLKKFNNQKPSEYDIKWSLLNKKIKEAIQNDDWNAYSSLKLDMGEVLRAEMRFSEALFHYFEMCYIDINGPFNCGPNRVPELSEEFPKFDPDNRGGLFYTSVIKDVLYYSNMDLEDVKQNFMKRASKLQEVSQAPISPSQSWQYLETEFKSQT